MSQLFQRKAIADLLPGDGDTPGSLRRTLGAGDLIMLAIGAVIGAGIFSSIGTAAAGEVLPSGEVIRYGAGPALILSFLLLGLVCGLAALCYAELASMIPQAGSAYAYSYATLGELIAWIIGWDLILEYAVGNIAVAIAWSGYFTSLLGGVGRAAPRLPDPRLPHGAAQPRSRRERPAPDRPAHCRRAAAAEPAGVHDRDADHLASLHRRQGEHPRQQHHGGRQAARAGAVRRRRRDCTSTRTTTRPSRRTAGAASIRVRRSCSSRISDSTRSRRPPRKRATRSATCRSGFWAGSPSARLSISSSASWRPGSCRTRS